MGLISSALACWLATMIVCESFLFEPVRALAERVHHKIGYLFNCTLCMGTWVGLAAALAFPQVRPLGHRVFLGWLGAALAIKAIAHLIYIGQKLIEPLSKLFAEKSLAAAHTNDYRGI